MFYGYREAAEALGMTKISLQLKVWRWNKANPDKPIRPDGTEAEGLRVRHVFTDEGIDRLRTWLLTNPAGKPGPKPKPKREEV